MAESCFQGNQLPASVVHSVSHAHQGGHTPGARAAWKTPTTSSLQKPHPPSLCEPESERLTREFPQQQTPGGGPDIPLARRVPPPLSPFTSHPSPPVPNLTPHTVPQVVPLTGDSRADADILAFCRARQQLLNNRGLPPIMSSQHHSNCANYRCSLKLNVTGILTSYCMATIHTEIKHTLFVW